MQWAVQLNVIQKVVQHHQVHTKSHDSSATLNIMHQYKVYA